MRAIIFRGKRIHNGKWMYGFYVRLEDSFRKPIDGKERISHRIYTGFADSCASSGGYDFSGDWDEVNPETIGQFTGLHDKNGKEIYEGDIISLISRNSKTFKVYWNDSMCNFLLVNDDTVIVMYKDDENHYKVIGNIHDGKEESK